MSGIDDDELDSYIMSEKESKYKGTLWNKVNAEYLEQQKGMYIGTSIAYRLSSAVVYLVSVSNKLARARRVLERQMYLIVCIEDKEEKRLKEKEEGKPEKKRRRTAPRKNKNQGPANSAGEAIEKMLQEKRISSKINYEVLKSLSVATLPGFGGRHGDPDTVAKVPGSPRPCDAPQTLISSPGRGYVVNVTPTALCTGKALVP